MAERPKRTGSSGEHAAVKGYRAKLDSIAESTLPALRDLNARIDALRSKSDSPEADPTADREGPPTPVPTEAKPKRPFIPPIPRTDPDE